ncbi:HNH endonuclease signature motif containing protein [Syntrophomonas palmitatica]|uniref:HNH endonuclease signature motif containing protein n=1 Tax=Syntrophomonas palmitatica TaxID=402877 RepID=UPI0006D0494C|nr:HNH endonuclease signature motif containing protein [Syntrophomonas palmitatica]
MASHHVRPRGWNKDRNLDIKEDLICLCPECHTKTHSGNIPRWSLIEIIARREGKTPTEICEIIGLLVNNTLPKDYIFTEEKNLFFGKNLEEVLQVYCNCDEAEETAKWLKAEVLTAMVDMKIKVTEISSLVGCSPASVRESIKTFRAFPEPHMRALDKSFTHHRIAAKTTNPQKWMDVACIQALSTRQLREAILAETNNNTIIKDANQEKAERALRMIKEVLNAGEAPAVWLKGQMYNILEVYYDNNARIA